MRKGVFRTSSAVPLLPAVRGACEILGLDPLCVASEGRVVLVVDAAAADRVLDTMRSHPLGRAAACVGRVVAAHAGSVVARSAIGGSRLVAMLSGEQLPRIC